ncbi:P-loop containing nucleoside triphosphate hydrolase protein [Cylindrobasidium torrendii FP15055 ss-10]|uniref:p-loop containing nucleoside triphosphate hydrolase protein n=1 Tax=Cylindrobasidium torrendii FP15055 ss-10 TaxID=1314674 RepID=A0A0D7BTQ4_9AGAR|nr:P-loop containing nucleoside triphosphate hydrolase protein [Cylindrobasidium torrendii FP15055 ss-10]
MVGGESGTLSPTFRFLIFGTIIEAGRRLCMWLMERARIQCSVTARFEQGDPSYDWIFHFLTQEKVWTGSRDFRVSAKSSQRQWGVEGGPAASIVNGNAEYVPTYDLPQLFRWKGYWLEVRRTLAQQNGDNSAMGLGDAPQTNGTIFITIYSLRMGVLSELVEEARVRYKLASNPQVIVHSIDSMMASGYMSFGKSMWRDVKCKRRRPIDSIVLPHGLLDSLLHVVREFVSSEAWYNQAGIPHRMGFLLYGPPGTGKSSTIYALASELGFEIYTLSLASQGMDDHSLRRAASAIPKHSIFLIEDIDCAFPSREDEENDRAMQPYIPPGYQTYPRQSAVTMSGLLNVIDGVGSEEGRLFFATTNYIDRLDPALLRPGRIDQKVEYRLATESQARALYLRFFPNDILTKHGVMGSSGTLADQFASQIPSGEFSTAELQGYLLGYKHRPQLAAQEASSWVEQQRREGRERSEREEKARMKREEQMKKRSEMLGNRAGLPEMPFLGDAYY